jgi:site-specific recombinase XerD
MRQCPVRAVLRECRHCDAEAHAMTGSTALARALRSFLSEYLPQLRGTSPHTIRSYRDALVLLLRFVAARRSRPVATFDFDDIEAADVLAFLDHLERERGNSAATRNVRLAALHCFFRYAATDNPEQLPRSQSILAIPFKRCRDREVEYLEYDEVRAVLAGVDRSIPAGRRDYALLATMFNTGARVQEILDLRGQDLQLSKPFQILLTGKGRKERVCPIWPQTAQLLRALCGESRVDLWSTSPVFLNHRGQCLTRFGVRYILRKYLERAKPRAATLRRKRLHPHSMRHSAAVHLLKSGVDMSTISHWLGHASIDTTNRYASIDLEAKREALARTQPPAGRSRARVWRGNASVLEWLTSL